MAPRTVEVEIQGQRYSLVSDEGPDHLREVAAVVDGSLREVSGGRPSVTYHTAVLAAMNIASDLVKLRRQHETMKEEIDSRTRSLIEIIDEQLSSTSRL